MIFVKGRIKLGESWGGERSLAEDSNIARLNIEHFRKLLAIEIDETKRQTVLRLLAEEEAKLAAATNSPTGKRKS